MFTKLFKKLAGKAGLDNIRFDLGQLTESFPRDPAGSSKLLFQLYDQVSLAFANHVPRQDLKTLVCGACQSCGGLQQILERLFAMAGANFDDDHAAASSIEQDLKDCFLSATGFPLDYSQRTSFRKGGSGSQQIIPHGTQMTKFDFCRAPVFTLAKTHTPI